MIKILLATPAYGNMVNVGFMRSVMKAATELSQEGIQILFYSIGNESLVTRARNTCVAQFLISDCTHLLFIDSDIEFDTDVIRRLVSINKDVACACYPMKTIDWKNIKDLVLMNQHVIEKMSEDELQGYFMKYNVQFTKEKEYCRPVLNGFMQVDYAATGFMLIKRLVFIKMRKKFPELQYKCLDVDVSLQPHLWAFFDTLIDEDKYYLSEDWTFCKRWRENCEGEVWLDLVSPLTHVGSYAFKGCVAQKMNFGKKPDLLNQSSK